MNNITEKIKNFNVKAFVAQLPKIVENHSLTVLIVLAGVLVGFSLFSVSSLTQTASSQNVPNNGDTPAPLSSLNISSDIEEVLIGLQEDEDVSISSNIASYRRSAFGDATNESLWVVDAAQAIEEYASQNEFYPTEDSIVSVLRAAAIAPEDTEDRTVNTAGSDYSYKAEGCQNGRCSGFFLAANVEGGIYQLGETDFTKRAWVNTTAEALDAFSKSSTDRLYPTEKDLIPSLTQFYEETLSGTFDPADPTGASVNDDDSAYSYRGIDCTIAGCSSFVLRTTFKDGALYFQQSQ